MAWPTSNYRATAQPGGERRITLLTRPSGGLVEVLHRGVALHQSLIAMLSCCRVRRKCRQLADRLPTTPAPTTLARLFRLPAQASPVIHDRTPKTRYHGVSSSFSINWPIARTLALGGSAGLIWTMHLYPRLVWLVGAFKAVREGADAGSSRSFPLRRSCRVRHLLAVDVCVWHQRR